MAGETSAMNAEICKKLLYLGQCEYFLNISKDVVVENW